MKGEDKVFHAIKCTGEQVSLLNRNWKRKELEEERQKYKYYCPACHHELILKLGYKQTWHFAHRKQASCESAVRGETEIHHRAKLLIYEWLKNFGYNPFIEHYLKEVRQRPDVFVTIGGKQVVFEVQQVPIPDEIFRKRSENYKKLHIDERWVGIHTEESLTYFYPTKRHFSFMMKTKPELHSIVLDLERKTWVIYKYFRFISPHKVLALPHYFSMKNAPKDFLRLKNLQPIMNKGKFDQLYFSYWKNEVRKKRQKVYLSITPTEKYVLTIFQRYFLNLNYFPPICALPLTANVYFTTFWWQAWLMLEYIMKTDINGTISVRHAVNKLMELIDKKFFHLRPLQKQKRDMVREGVIQYFQALTNFSLLEQKFAGIYIVKKHVAMDKQLDMLMKEDVWVQKKMETFWRKNIIN